MTPETDLPPLCAAIIHGGTPVDPPEYCDQDAVPGHDYCPGHLDGGWDTDDGWPT